MDDQPSTPYVQAIILQLERETYALAKAEAIIVALKSALQRIVDGGDCACEHDENCCALVDNYCCSDCIAATALAEVDRLLDGRQQDDDEEHPAPATDARYPLTDASTITIGELKRWLAEYGERDGLAEYLDERIEAARLDGHSEPQP